jgi:hypothetical protein
MGQVRQGVGEHFTVGVGEEFVIETASNGRARDGESEARLSRRWVLRRRSARRSSPRTTWETTLMSRPVRSAISRWLNGGFIDRCRWYVVATTKNCDGVSLSGTRRRASDVRQAEALVIKR